MSRWRPIPNGPAPLPVDTDALEENPTASSPQTRCRTCTSASPLSCPPAAGGARACSTPWFRAMASKGARA